ncbi:MAG: glycosyltransferase family 4 protein [Acidobacteriota bacterium]
MKRVLCINATGHFAGAEAMLVDLVARLDRSRWDPLVLVPFEGELSGELGRLGVECRVWPLAALRTRRELRSPAAFARLGRQLPSSVTALVGLMQRERVALVHTNSSVVLDGALSARLAGLPHVWHVREVLSRPRAAWSVLRWLIVGLSARVLCVSQGVADHFGVMPRAMRRRLDVVHDGVADPGSLPGWADARSGAGQPPVVGMVGRINGHKGQEDFLRAAAILRTRHPSARFVLVGGALPAYERLADQLRRLAVELGVSGCVVFMGQQPRGEVRRLLASFSVFVMPSRVVEGFGLAALEAMAAGLPVVGTEAGARELVRDGREGLLVPRRDPDALAAAVDSLLTSPMLARRLGQEGQRRALTELTIERHVEKVESIYEQLLGAVPTPAPHTVELDRIGAAGSY